MAELAASLAAAAMLLAHPLGNFSVNEYAGLSFTSTGVRVTAVVNTAELPTVQDLPLVDTDGDGSASDAERARYAGTACADLAAAFEVRVGPERLIWTVSPGGYEYGAGAGGLPTARLSCILSAPADLTGPVTVTVANRYRADRVGWHELTATADGLHLVDPPVPARSLTDELRSYPTVDSPSKVVDVRTATLRLAPGPAAGPAAAPTGVAGPGRLAGATAWADRRLADLAGRRLTPLMALVAMLSALLLGAAHAALPGHGKTVLAAYLAGRRGRPRDAVVVGATVTATHTAAVLILGVLLTTATAFAGERVLACLGLASGLLIAAVGVGMVVGALRRRAHGHDHAHAHHHPHRGQLAGIGIAGGLVPSPSALVVLLAAAGIGRTGFGVLLVGLYGLGMAGALTAAGLLVLAVQRRLTGAPGRLARLGAALAATAPWASAAIVVIVGIGLTLSAATGLA